MLKIDYSKSDRPHFSLICSPIIQGIIKHIKRGDFTIERDSPYFKTFYNSDYSEKWNACYHHKHHLSYMSGMLNPIENLFARYGVVTLVLDKKYINWFEDFTNYRIVKRTSVLHSGLWQLNCIDQ